MNSRKPLLPRLESLETKTVMSARPAAHPAAVVGPEHGAASPWLSSHDMKSLASIEIQTVELNGQAEGSYTSRQGQPDSGTRYHVNASGTITPIGLAVVTGSFSTPGVVDGRVATASLTIMGPKGKLHLKLTESGPVPAVRTTDQADAINPGGPMITGSTPTSESTVSDPIIFVHTFQFEIVSGAGHYAHARGKGTVRIDTGPGLATPTGPGTYSSSLASTAGLGRTNITFVA